MAKQGFVGRVLSPIREFIQDSRAVGIVLISCTFVSLAISNLQPSGDYIAFWEREIHMPLPELHLPHTVLHVVNDALMAIFFFLVGLEIKRELMVGELSSVRKAAMPGIAALGGMVMPAFIYFLLCGQTPYSKGWGVPMATDIAFSLGVISLLGKRAPISLRIFLTALAIIDDLGGILAIAIFYAEQINTAYFFAAFGVLALLVLLNLLKVRRYYVFYLIGALLWYLVFNSGVHATIAGVALAFTMPLHKIDALEHALHDPVNFIILPIFAMANTAIILPADMSGVFSMAASYGIIAGLVVGKPLGIVLFSRLSVKLGLASLPDGITWKQLTGMGMIAGIGFTMSIFIATLAFDDQQVQLTAKMAIIAASVLAGAVGFIYLKLIGRRAAA